MSMEAMRELAGQVYPYWLVVIFVVFVAKFLEDLQQGLPHAVLFADRALRTV